MPELRQNFYSKAWVVIATERAKRPEQLIVHREPRLQASVSPNFPFCPGNENQTPPEVLRLPNGDGSWKVRAIPDKFGALAREVPPARAIHGFRRTIQGSGCITSSSKRPIIPSPWHCYPIATWRTCCSSTRLGTTS